MRVPTVRQAPMGLPRLATTGVGSLPHARLEEGLRLALSLDIPFLPQLPVGHPSELMIPQALEGLPGLRWDERGQCTVDLAAWEAGRADFEARLEQALASGALEPFEPSPEGCRAWRPFVEAVRERAPAFAKAQLAGAFTVLQATRTSAGTPVAQVPGLEGAVGRLTLARALAMVKALRHTGTTPLFFLDEPGLGASERTAPEHARTLGALRERVAALRGEGARVGLHCCGDADWAGLLGLGLDVLSLDVRLSLDALLEESGPLARFLDSGATLGLGLVPTTPASSREVDALVDAVDVSLESALPPGCPVDQVGLQLLLTPACGLAGCTVEEAEALLAELTRAQRLLAGALAARSVAPPFPE